MNLRQRIDELLDEHGCYRVAEEATGIDGGYLHRLRNGTKDNPSNDTCKRLGLKKRMVIEYKKL